MHRAAARSRPQRLYLALLGMVVGEGLEPSEALASRFTVCPR